MYRPLFSKLLPAFPHRPRGAAWEGGTVHLATTKAASSDPFPSSLSPPSSMAHFNSLPFSKVSGQKARFQVQANKPEDKSTWPALDPGRLYTSTLNLWRANTRPPSPALEFHSAGSPCPEPPSNWQVYVNNGPELKLQRQNMCKRQQSAGWKPLYNHVFHPQNLNVVPEFNEIFK